MIRRYWFAPLLFASCAARQPQSSGPIVLEDMEGSSNEPPIESVEIPRTRTGSVPRSRFEEILDEGVGAILTQVDVSEVKVRGTFVGWKVSSMRNEWVDLIPGDIVLSVNGAPLETPAQVHSLWLSLRGVDEVVINAEVVDGNAKPLYVHAKQVQPSEAS